MVLVNALFRMHEIFCSKSSKNSHKIRKSTSTFSNFKNPRFSPKSIFSLEIQILGLLGRIKHSLGGYLKNETVLKHFGALILTFPLLAYMEKSKDGVYVGSSCCGYR